MSSTSRPVCQDRNAAGAASDWTPMTSISGRMAFATTHADRERREQMLKNAERTRQLAEKAQAELDKRKEQKT